jgi:hypothetical protein
MMYHFPHIGTETSLGISAEVSGGFIRDWTNRKYDEYWQSIGQRAFLTLILLMWRIE